MGLLYLKPNYVMTRRSTDAPTVVQWLEDVTRAVNDLQRDLVNAAEPNLFINSAGTTTAGTSTATISTAGTISLPTACLDTLLINVNGVKRRILLFTE